MTKLHLLGCLLATTFSLGLTGCQTLRSTSTSNSSTHVAVSDQFILQGKIGVRTPQQSGSAFFNWVQQQAQFDIELSGILGVGKTQISGKPGLVTLNSVKTGLIHADSPEELLLQATGWQAPITHLKEWVQARSVSDTAHIQKDSAGRFLQLQEQGWTVDYAYDGNETLPNRLILKQSLENGGENRITIIIQNRSNL